MFTPHFRDVKKKKFTNLDDFTSDDEINGWEKYFYDHAFVH